jgi:AcrR family transcriptional regulator
MGGLAGELATGPGGVRTEEPPTEGDPSEPEAPRAPGRPRSHEADRAILDATLDLLIEEGYSGVTIEGVAARAGVAKTTIYRRWPSKAEMVVEAIGATAEKLPIPKVGSTRAGLAKTLAHTISRMSADPSAGRILMGLAAETCRNEELADAVRRGIVEKRRRAMFALLERGIAQGEIRPDIDLDLVADMLGGPVLFRLLLGGDMDPRIASRAVDMLIEGIGAKPPRS